MFYSAGIALAMGLLIGVNVYTDGKDDSKSSSFYLCITGVIVLFGLEYHRKVIGYGLPFGYVGLSIATAVGIQKMCQKRFG